VNRVGFYQFVYLLIAGGFVKVGRTSDVFNRIRQLQCGCPSKIVPVAAFGELDNTSAGAIEREMHQRMRSARSHGEWFSCDPKEALSLLATIGFSFVGGRFFTFKNQYEWLVKECVEREHACRSGAAESRLVAESELRRILARFPSMEAEMISAVNSLPPIMPLD
jgi:hypothetical protein